jgi:putative Holliday junction resolvase
VNSTERILCIDFGLKFMGFAVADYPGITARALETIRPDRTDALAAIARMIETEKVTRILVGFPFSDVEGDIHRNIHSFRESLAARFQNVPIDYVDESYSSAEAEELAATTGIGKNRKKRSQDSQAAKIVLLRYLAET